MRAALVALALAFLPAAAVAAPVGAPRTVRVSRPADERAHPAARTESWELLAVDPRSRAMLAIRLQHADGWPTATVAIREPQRAPVRMETDQVFRGGGAHGARFEGPASRTLATWRRGRVTLDIADPQVRGRLTLAGQPGPLARGFDLGEAVRYPAATTERVVLSYNVPVAAGRLRGSLDLGGRSLRLDGWRGTWDHVWGSFARDDRNWAFWDSYVVHDAGGAWIAFGLNRRDAVLGPGARDGQWLGVLARAGRRSVRVCRPRIDRRRWLPVSLPGEQVAHRLTARCGRRRVRFADQLTPDPLRGDAYNGIVQWARPATAPRGFGIARHDSHDR